MGLGKWKMLPQIQFPCRLFWQSSIAFVLVVNLGRCAMATSHENLATPPRVFRQRAWTAVRIALGLLLLTAAGLKLAGRGVSAVPQVGWFATPTIQIAAAEWEMVLSLWLLSGAYPSGAWLASLCTFAIFGCVSFYLAREGVASCGCFGAINASPWWAFGVDVAVIGLLALAQPSFAEVRAMTRSVWRRQFLRGGGILVSVGGVLATLMIVGNLVYGSADVALARLRGDMLTVSPSHLDFGSGTADDQVSRTIEITNWSNSPVRILGGTSDCTCVTTDGLPITILPGESCPLSVRVHIKPGMQGRISRTVKLMTNCHSEPVVEVRILGQATVIRE